MAEISERELRLECLKLAKDVQPQWGAPDIIEEAQAFYLYCVNGTPPDGKTATPAAGTAEAGATAG